MFLFLPRLSAVSQQDDCHCFLHVLNLSFDDLLLTHGINSSVKFTGLCEAAKDLPIAFIFDRRKEFLKKQEEKPGVLILNNIIYIKINLRASSTQRDIRKPIKLTTVWKSELSVSDCLVSGSLDVGLGSN